MKVLNFATGILTVTVILSSTNAIQRRQEEDTTILIVPSGMVEKILKDMPIESMNVYSKRFYPSIMNFINRKLYSRRARTKTQPVEKRIRNIKVNQFLNIPNDRKDAQSSSYAYLAKNESTSFVVYTVPGEKGGQQLIDINAPDIACIFGMSEEHTAVKAKKCREDVPNMLWELIPNTFGDFWIRQQGTSLCLAPVLNMGHPFLLQLLACDRYNPYLIWEIQDRFIYFKK